MDGPKEKNILIRFTGLLSYASDAFYKLRCFYMLLLCFLINTLFSSNLSETVSIFVFAIMGKHYFFVLSALWFSFRHCQALSRNEKLTQENQKVFIWNKTTEDFRNFQGKSISEFSTNSKKSIYSLKNVTVRVLADNMEPYIMSYAQNSTISGFLADTWYILEKFLHFKSNITSLPDFDVGLAKVSKHEADVYLAAAVHFSGLTGITFSQPYFWTSYHLYYKLPEGRPAMYVHFKVFSLALWFNIIGVYVLLTLTIWLICTILKKVCKKGEICLSPVAYFMGISSAFFNTGYDLKLRSCSARMLVFSGLIFGTLCYYALSASLVARLAVLDRPMLFQKLEDVEAKKTHFLCVRNVSFVFNNFTDKKRVMLPKWRGILNTDACPNVCHWTGILKIICNDNVAVLENRILMSLVLNDNSISCAVTHVPQRYFNTGNYISLSSRFKGKNTLKKLLNKMKAYGILQKLEQKWILKGKYGTPSITGANQINFHHVKGLLSIYFLMALFSLLLLVLEILCKKYWIVIKTAFENIFEYINLRPIDETIDFRK